MTPIHKANTTKLEIIQTATRMFLHKGYTATSVKSISDELNISTGNLTFHYPTKEHMLAVLTQMLADFQRNILERFVNDGTSSLLALCLELPAITAVCEENKIAKDFYLSAYTHPLSLDIIRKNDILKAKQVFAPFCPDWTESQFIAAETLVSGIEYATLMTTPTCAPLNLRVASALDAIMSIYQVPEETRSTYIHSVLSMDFRGLGQQILQEFMQYIEAVTEQALENKLRYDKHSKV